MTAVAEKLREARKLIERGWTQKAGARDASGIEIWSGDHRAVAWCSLIAICEAGKEDYLSSSLFNPFRQAIGLTPAQGISGWNDAPERTRAEVLEAFDKAIALAESGQ